VVSELAPGAATGRHYHPGDVVAYLLSGSMVHTVDGKASETIRAGEAWHETERDVHEGRNPGSVPARFVTVQVSQKGQPLTVAVK
jgi:quercetin dioxygenase-like cupin family protein